MDVAHDRQAGVSTRPTLWRVTRRSSFDALRRSGRRVRQGPLTVTWLPPNEGERAAPPRVAFAIGRAAGNAVIRNRIRRRLRAALQDQRARGALPSGTYLLSGAASLASMPWSELTAALTAALDATGAKDPR